VERACFEQDGGVVRKSLPRRAVWIHFHFLLFSRILLDETIQPFQQEQRVVGFFAENRNLWDGLRDIAMQFHGKSAGSARNTAGHY
jgi:hypothetical protein